MKRSIYFLSAFISILILFILIDDLKAQRNVDYRQLVTQNQQNPVTVNTILLPDTSDSTVTMATLLSLSYNYLPFRKVNNPSSDNEFFSTTELSIEIFESDRSRLNKNDKDVSLKGLRSVTRDFWADTAYAKNYEQTQSNEHFLTGYLQASLEPGIYSYALQMQRGDKVDSRMSKARTIEVKPYSQMETGNIIFADTINNDGQKTQLQLSPLGKNVEYGKDFYALIYLPAYNSDDNYSLELTNMEVSDEDTSEVSTIFTHKLTPAEIKPEVIPKLASPNGSNHINLNLTSSKNGFTYALIRIPNKKLPNALYQLTVNNEDENKLAARETFRSIWVDMPRSLLNLDVAINMLHYIVDEKTLDRISTGTQEEREKKFREFWKERDPTPETHYNELMAEYYRRIDYAYENFTTSNSVGYNSDQGEVYIKFGAPDNIERKFPTNGRTTEIWTYPSQKFVFQATTGFGDFRLVSKESR